MFDQLDPTDGRLLDDFQRDFPLCPEPFGRIGEALGVGQQEVLARLERMRRDGLLTRVGATVRPNTVGASTLAAMAVPARDVDAVAAIVGGEDGVNHNYLREHHWNLWFVATAPDRLQLDACLDRIEARTGLDLIDLPLVRAFTIDLGFSLAGRGAAVPVRRAADTSVLRDGDAALLDFLARGMPLSPRPFGEMAEALGRTEAEILSRIEILLAAGIVTRLGVIVRHRSVGWSANAMVVWDVAPERIEEAGEALSHHPGVTLCYQRRTVPGLWPYALFSMIHARTRAEACEILAGASRIPVLRGVTHDVLFSTRAFKQTGPLIAAGRGKGETAHASYAAAQRRA